MREFETNVNVWSKARIDSDSVARILEKEKERFLGDKDRYIEDGTIRETDYRFNGSQEVGKATQKEIELYEAFLVLIDYFRKL